MNGKKIIMNICKSCISSKLLDGAIGWLDGAIDRLDDAISWLDGTNG